MSENSEDFVDPTGDEAHHRDSNRHLEESTREQR